MFMIGAQADEYENFNYSGYVIEVEPKKESDCSLKVIAPEEFKKKWPSVCVHYFKECPGPARKITWEEQKAIWKGIK